jgi:hypothetical protein
MEDKKIFETLVDINYLSLLNLDCTLLSNVSKLQIFIQVCFYDD